MKLNVERDQILFHFTSLEFGYLCVCCAQNIALNYYQHRSHYPCTHKSDDKIRLRLKSQSNISFSKQIHYLLPQTFEPLHRSSIVHYVCSIASNVSIARNLFVKYAGNAFMHHEVHLLRK